MCISILADLKYPRALAISSPGMINIRIAEWLNKSRFRPKPSGAVLLDDLHGAPRYTTDAGHPGQTRHRNRKTHRRGDSPQIRLRGGLSGRTTLTLATLQAVHVVSFRWTLLFATSQGLFTSHQFAPITHQSIDPCIRRLSTPALPTLFPSSCSSSSFRFFFLLLC